MQLESAELGKTYRDKITNFEGIATAEYRFLNGCLQYQLERVIENQGNEPLLATFDVQRLEEVDDGKGSITLDSQRPGGPHPVPRRRG